MGRPHWKSLIDAHALREGSGPEELAHAVATIAPDAVATVWCIPAGSPEAECRAAAAGATADQALSPALAWSGQRAPSGSRGSPWAKAGTSAVVRGVQIDTPGVWQSSPPATQPATLTRRLHEDTSGAWYLVLACASPAAARGLAPLTDLLAASFAAAPAAEPPHFRELVETGYGITLVLRNNVIRYANPATLGLLGYAREELYSEQFAPFTLVHPRDHDRLTRIYREARAGATPEMPVEITLVARDQSPIEVLATFSFHFGESGDEVHISALDISERVRLETELFAYTGQVGALQGVLIDILELDLTRAEILRRICESVHSIVGADLVSAFLFTPDRTELELQASHGPLAADGAWASHAEGVLGTKGTLPLRDGSDSALATCLTQRETVVVERASIPRKSPAGKRGFQIGLGSWLWVPLLQGSLPLGALLVAYRADRIDLNDSQVQSLSLFAAQAALAIQKAALVEQERRNQKQSAQLVVASAALREDLSLVGLHSRICTSARSLVPAESVVLLVPQDEQLVVRHVDGEDSPLDAADTFSISESVFGGALRSGTPVRVVNPGEAGAPARDMLVLPLVSQRQPVGVLALVNAPNAAPFSERDQQIMETFAQQAAATLDTAQLLAEVTETKEYLEHLLDSAHDVIYTHDLSGRLTSLNTAGRRLGGFNDPTAPLPNIQEIVHPEDLETALGHIAAKLDGREESQPYEIRVLDASGQYHTLELATRLIEREGEPVGVLGIGRNVTERRHLEAQVFRTEKLAALGGLLAGVAHELNNPLTGVLGYAELLSQSNDPAIRRQAERIHAEAQRCRAIVDSLLALHPDLVLGTDAVACGPLIEQTVALVNYRYKLDNVQVAIKGPTGSLMVQVPSDHLQQVLLHVLQNAYEAIVDTGRPGTVTVGVEEADDAVRITVEDDGPGVPAAMRDRLFDPFSTTKAGASRGLGLSMVNNVVTTAGGSISIDARRPRGTRVTLTFPSAGTAADTPMELLPPQAVDERRILVVDDEEVIRDLLTDLLEMMDYSVDAAADGQAALTLLAEHEYSGIISDVKMPGMDGIQFFAALETQHPHLVDRVLFTSGDTIAPDTRAFLESAGRPYLCKPFNLADLKEAVSRVVVVPVAV